MASLEELGINWNLEAGKLNYFVSGSQEKKQTSKEKQEHFKRIVRAISKDLRRRDPEDFRVSVNRDFYESLTLKDQIDMIATRKKYEKKTKSRLDTAFSIASGGYVLGGLGGLVFGFDFSTEIATKMAEVSNQYSHLLAPFTGVAQTIISIAGTALAGFAGALAGHTTGILASLPYDISHRNLSTEIRIFRELEYELTHPNPRR